jgi:hypothetical protein
VRRFRPEKFYQVSRKLVMIGISPPSAAHASQHLSRSSHPAMKSEAAGSRLHKALQGETDSKIGDRLVLSPSSTFEEIQPPGINVPLTENGLREFEGHMVYHLPRDVVMLRDANELGKVFDVIHRFVVREPTALNDGLTEWALHRERKCMIARVQTAVRPEQLSDLGKTTASNRGGFQSLSNIFDTWSEAQTGTRWPLAADPLARQQRPLPAERIDEPEELAGRPHLCNLHRIASEALDQACA